MNLEEYLQSFSHGKKKQSLETMEYFMKKLNNPQEIKGKMEHYLPKNLSLQSNYHEHALCKSRKSLFHKI